MPWDIPQGNRLTIFEQPRLDSGYPDVVLVLWDEPKTRKWPARRLSLGPYDLRIAHHLVMQGSTETSKLLSIFGKTTSARIANLVASGLVEFDGIHWCPRNVDEIFAVSQIVAIEAKISAPFIALDQASRNRWFASHSYILIPTPPRDTRAFRKANDLGIGVWSPDEDGWTCHIPSAVESVPRSYASWLFNEWVWRLSRIHANPDAGTPK